MRPSCHPGPASVADIGQLLAVQAPHFLALALVVGAGACGGGRDFSGPPSSGPTVPTTTAATVRVRLAPEESALADALGWQTGIPNAEVHVLRNGTAVWSTLDTDVNGEVVVPGVFSGQFRIYATRRLNAAESQLAGGVRAFGDGLTATLGLGTVIELELASDRAEGLVISELNPTDPPITDTNGTGYSAGHYVEIYNNSSQTRFLDGLLFGRAYFFGQRDFSFNSCAASQSTREDPNGIFTLLVLQFPGSGADHPIGPGETRLIANVAIDHTPVHPWLFDLSGADFEIHPVGAADNPSVPNMINVGTEPWRSTYLLATGDTYFLSEPADVAALPTAFRDHTGRGYVQLPADGIIDAVSFVGLNLDSDREFPPCAPMINQRFDRYELAVLEFGLVGEVEETNISYRRLGLRSEGGRTILQDTGTTAADFIMTDHTPGTVNP